jgi:hypothetical protein
LETTPSTERIYAKQVRLSEGASYEVYAVSVYDKVAFVQIVDDLQTPQFLPSNGADLLRQRVRQHVDERGELRPLWSFLRGRNVHLGSVLIVRGLRASCVSQACCTGTHRTTLDGGAKTCVYPPA